MAWPADVESITGRGWQALDGDEVRSSDGRHRLVRSDGSWRSEESVGDDRWTRLEFTYAGSLAGALDAFDCWREENPA